LCLSPHGGFKFEVNNEASGQLSPVGNFIDPVATSVRPGLSRSGIGVNLAAVHGNDIDRNQTAPLGLEIF
jgi:hypothetical protein